MKLKPSQISSKSELYTFVYLSKYVLGFFLVNTIEIGEVVSSSVKGIVNKDKASNSNLYLSCFVPVV